MQTHYIFSLLALLPLTGCSFFAPTSAPPPTDPNVSIENPPSQPQEPEQPAAVETEVEPEPIEPQPDVQPEQPVEETEAPVEEPIEQPQTWVEPEQPVVDDRTDPPPINDGDLNDPCAHGNGCNGGGLEFDEDKINPAEEGSWTDPNPVTNGAAPWNW